MNSLGLFASIVDSLAWPALFGLVVFSFKDSIVQLLQRLSRFKYKNLEADFIETLDDLPPIDETKKDAENLVPIVDNTITLLELADISPRVAILEAWAQIESSTRRFLESVGIERRKYYAGLRKLPHEYLQEIEQIVQPYEELRMLRNKAAHSGDFDLSPEVARRYIEKATWVEQTIRKASQ